jgi:pimeloyl-ACP methyl ester carboxylesterase
VLIHGLALDQRIWGDLPQSLSQTHQVLTYDLRGHGRSFAPETGYSFRDLVADLNELIAALEMPNVTLIGHSLGGAVAIKFALQHPAKVSKLILAAPHVVGYTDYQGWPNVYRTARMIDLDQARISWETFRLFGKLEDGSPEKELFLKCLKEFPATMWLDTQAGRYIDESDLKIVDKLTAPTLLLCGREDLDFLPVAKLINAQLPHGSLFEIPDCGHMIHLEKPEIFRRELATFLS